MTKLTPSMRLKVKRDTFILPDPVKGVYFRNNLRSFRMEGEMIDQWIEKLLPKFNGEFTLGNLTDGLPGPYLDRVYEIAEALLQNGFVRDVSQDRSHQLPEQVMNKYASQIEFLDSFADSGAYRFQSFRQTKVLAIGAGPILVSLVSALLETGLPKFHVLITDDESTNRERLAQLETCASTADPEVSVLEVKLQEKGEASWRDIVRSFDAVLYVSQEGDMEELQVLHRVCQEGKKQFLPAVCLAQAGVAGPLVHPESEGDWESAWRRIHRSVLGSDWHERNISSTAGAMLANIIVFEWFKKVTGVTNPREMNRFFLLDLETLEGKWHSFLPHPLVTGRARAEWVQDLELQIKQSSGSSDVSKLLSFFGQLTSAESGIFHLWEEGDLKQLPLAQCRVQAVNPMLEGPAELFPEIVCSGLTHQEARRESGLTGIEQYVSSMTELLINTLPPHPLHREYVGRMIDSQEFVGIGAGETLAEGVFRGLQRYLHRVLSKQKNDQGHVVSPVQAEAIEDGHCSFYLQSLALLQGEPIIGLGEAIYGFPVVWVGINGRWYGSVSVNQTIALRNALQQALMKAQHQTASLPLPVLEVPSVLLTDKTPQFLVIPESPEVIQPEDLHTAIQILAKNNIRLLVIEFKLESLLQEELSGVFGVVLREGVPR